MKYTVIKFKIHIQTVEAANEDEALELVEGFEHDQKTFFGSSLPYIIPGDKLDETVKTIQEHEVHLLDEQIKNIINEQKSMA